MKTYDPLALQGLGKLSFQSIRMGFFHAEDDVGPSHMPFGDNDASVGLRANGTDLIER